MGVIESTVSWLAGAARVLLVSVVILLLGFIIGQLAGRIVQRALHEMELDKTLRKLGGRMRMEQLLATTTKAVIYLITAIIVLGKLGVASIVLNIVLAAVILLLAAMILLGVKDFIPNVIAGISIQRKHQLQEGDFIRVNNLEGRIAAFDLQGITLTTKAGDTLYVPNVMLKRQLVIKKRRK